MKRTKIIAILIIGYVITFFMWWTFLLIRIENERFLAAEQSNNMVNLKKHQRNVRMVFMEGGVFIVLLFGLSYLALRTIKNREKFIENKKNFLLSTAHELRSPLAALKLNLQTLTNKKLTETQTERLLELSLKETERLIELTDKSLLAAQLGSKDVNKKNAKSINLSKLYQQEIKKNANLSRVTTCIQENVYAIGLETTFISILNNLIGNSLKYTKGNIHVSLVETLDGSKLQIEDEGPGIAKDELTRIWNMFYRVGNETYRETEGVGLGLHIVKEMVENLGGIVSVESDIKKGSIFSITFKHVEK